MKFYDDGSRDSDEPCELDWDGKIEPDQKLGAKRLSSVSAAATALFLTIAAVLLMVAAYVVLTVPSSAEAMTSCLQIHSHDTCAYALER